MLRKITMTYYQKKKKKTNNNPVGFRRERAKILKWIIFVGACLRLWCFFFDFRIIIILQ